MAGVAQNMLRSALQAFVAGDAVGAEAVILADTAMDTWMARLSAEVQGAMRRDPATVSPGLATISFARHIERLAAHATNVAEMVIYLIRGRDVRHGTPA
jgi:phosphate transport system protein